MCFKILILPGSFLLEMIKIIEDKTEERLIVYLRIKINSIKWLITQTKFLYLKHNERAEDLSFYLHVWWWNLFPFKKHLLGDSIHSQMHFAGFSGWCLGQVFLHTHWHLSSSNSLLGPQEVGRSLFLHMHWHEDLSNSLWGSQLEGRTPPLQTHWQVSSSSSLFGPQIWNASDGSRNTAEKLQNYHNFVFTHSPILSEEMTANP